MKLLRGLLYTVAGIALLATLLLFGARFADGPLGIVAGGPFKSGELVSGPEPDWRFVADLPTVEFQLLNPARSRTTWIVEHEGRIFIPCGYMTTTWGKLWKRWPVEAERDGRALLRVGGKLYQRQLVRLREDPVLQPLVSKLARKYQVPATLEAVESGKLWVFEMVPAKQGAKS